MLIGHYITDAFHDALTRNRRKALKEKNESAVLDIEDLIQDQTFGGPEGGRS